MTKTQRIAAEQKQFDRWARMYTRRIARGAPDAEWPLSQCHYHAAKLLALGVVVAIPS